MKKILIGLLLFFDLSADVSRYIEFKKPVFHSKEDIRLLYDTSFIVIDSKGRIRVEKIFTPKELRGLTKEEVLKYLIKSNGYLVVNKFVKGGYSIHLNQRLKGGMDWGRIVTTGVLFAASLYDRRREKRRARRRRAREEAKNPPPAIVEFIREEIGAAEAGAVNVSIEVVKDIANTLSRRNKTLLRYYDAARVGAYGLSEEAKEIIREDLERERRRELKRRLRPEVFNVTSRERLNVENAPKVVNLDVEPFDLRVTGREPLVENIPLEVESLDLTVTTPTRLRREETIERRQISPIKVTVRNEGTMLHTGDSNGFNIDSIKEVVDIEVDSSKLSRLASEAREESRRKASVEAADIINHSSEAPKRVNVDIDGASINVGGLSAGASVDFDKVREPGSKFRDAINLAINFGTSF